MNLSSTLVLALTSLVALATCSPNEQRQPAPFSALREVVDLGALVTEDLPERVWGRALLTASGYERPNSFDVIRWERQRWGGSASGSNAYYTFFNHGGPHVDAPNHIGLRGGLDSYPIEAFSGPVKIFDVRQFPAGRSIPAEVFHGSVRPSDVVLILTGYEPPVIDKALPDYKTLTWAAAEYLADVPIRAFGTDALSLGHSQHPGLIEAESKTAKAMPNHYAFLSRGIPVYEQLLNLSKLLDKRQMYFVGVPLNVRGGDGMIVRPVVFIY